MRLIDADALEFNPDPYNAFALNGVAFVGRRSGKTAAMVTNALKYMIDNAPTIEAEPVRHGRWEWTQSGWCCSVCYKKSLVEAVAFAKYCHRCGAKMDGKEG